MPPIIPNPKSIKSFTTAAAFEKWLRANHDSATELYLKIHKKDSGLATVTYAEALDVALCWGWIDGLKKSFDADSFLQRFTPRKAASMWSQINTKHIERLTTAGRMQPPGQAQVDAAKLDGRWDKAYSAGKDMVVPDDLMAAIRKKPRALRMFETLNRVNTYALAFRVGTLKTAATRAKRIDQYVAMLERGEMLHPPTKGKAN